jgi:hypothetical protein
VNRRSIFIGNAGRYRHTAEFKPAVPLRQSGVCGNSRVRGCPQPAINRPAPRPALTRAIRRNDGEALFEHSPARATSARGIVEIGQDSAASDFGRPHANRTKKPD